MAKFAKINSREILKCSICAKISSRKNFKKKLKFFLQKLVVAKIDSLKVNLNLQAAHISLTIFINDIASGTLETDYTIHIKFLFKGVISFIFKFWFIVHSSFL